MTDLPTFERPWLSHYPPGVPPHVEVPDRSLPSMIAESVRQWPDRTAFVYYGSKWSYSEFWDLSGRFAAALAREGFRAGDRLALYLPNCPAYPIAFFGALRLGVTVVQVSPLFLGQDLARLLRDASPRGIVTLTMLAPNLEKIRSEVELPLIVVGSLREFNPFPRRLLVNSALKRLGLSVEFPSGPNVRRWAEFVKGDGRFPAPEEHPATDVAVLQYTGGTTGTPKAAMLTHRNLVANALQCRAWFNVPFSGVAVFLTALPLFHVYAMTVAMNHPLIEGATIVLATRPIAGDVLKLTRKYHPSHLPGVPALYQQILQHPKVGRYDLKSIRVCVSGAAPLPQEVARQFESVTGGSLVEGYGLSEASPVTHANPIDGERRAGSIGLPLPDTDHVILDPDTGTVLPAGGVGELAVRGPQVMLGYYHQESETARVLRDGWLKTGDIARVDPEGYVYIVDRKKDMIIVGGLKVYPREVEEVLFQHPAVAEAAVIGVPDRARGEVVQAFVVRKIGASVTEDELIEFVRARIAHYKAPRSVEFRSELPKSAVQKVLRRVLRERAPAATDATLPAR